MKFLLTSALSHIFSPPNILCIHVFKLICIHSVWDVKKCWCGAFSGVLPLLSCWHYVAPVPLLLKRYLSCQNWTWTEKRTEETWTRSRKSMPIYQIRYKNTWKNGGWWRTTTSKSMKSVALCMEVYFPLNSLHRYFHHQRAFLYSLENKTMFTPVYSVIL